MVKKPKIIFLLHLPPPIHGSSVMGLSIKESKLINEKFNCYHINLLASNKVADSGVISFKKLFDFYITWYKLLFLLIRHRPQLCYFAITVNGAAFYRDLLLVFIIKLFRIRIIYHLHNKGASMFQHLVIKNLCYRYVFRNTEVILISKLLYQDIQTYVPITSVNVCPNGILEHKYISSSDKLGYIPFSPEDENHKPVNLLFLSNLIESKGVYILLEACSLLKKNNLLFNCVFIGGESDITSSLFYERINKLDIQDVVSYQGVKFGEDKIKAFAETDIFVFPTFYYYETFGLVILEAMQQSKPVISTFEGGIPDIIDDGITGFIIPQKDVETLTSKLEILIKNPDMRIKMGQAGRRKYEQQYTQQIFEKRFVEILQTVIEK